MKTEDPTVVATYSNWIQSLVQEYNIDGLRIDGMFFSWYMIDRQSTNKCNDSCEVRNFVFMKSSLLKLEIGMWTLPSGQCSAAKQEFSALEKSSMRTRGSSSRQNVLSP